MNAQKQMVASQTANWGKFHLPVQRKASNLTEFLIRNCASYLLLLQPPFPNNASWSNEKTRNKRIFWPLENILKHRTNDFYLLMRCTKFYGCENNLKRITKEYYQTDGFCRQQQKGNNMHNHFQLLFVWQKLEKLKNSHLTFLFSICSFHLNWTLHLQLNLFHSLTNNSYKNLMLIIPQILFIFIQHAAKTQFYYNLISI